MRRSVLNSLLYFPERDLAATPADAGLSHRELRFESRDGERLHGWWIEAEGPSLAHVLLCHGNGGNIGDRVLHARLLTAVGLDVLLWDYRGYGQSSGRPSEEGTYADARAAHDCLLAQPGVDPARVVYLGESLGGAVALELALERPPAVLVLLSAFTSVRAMSKAHYGLLPAAAVPDAYPSIDRIPELRAPLLILHGDRDEIVPFTQGQELHEAAPEPKRMHVFPGVGHNDLVEREGSATARAVASFAEERLAGRGDGGAR